MCIHIYGRFRKPIVNLPALQDVCVFVVCQVRLTCQVDATLDTTVEPEALGEWRTSLL